MTTSQAFSHYLTGIETLDASHWGIIDLINEVIAHGKSNDMSLLPNILYAKEKLIVARDGLESHFKFENSHMESTKFPYIVYHKQNQGAVTLTLNRIIDALDNPAPVYSQYLLSKFQQDLLDHIDRYDLSYAAYLTQKNK